MILISPFKHFLRKYLFKNLNQALIKKEIIKVGARSVISGLSVTLPPNGNTKGSIVIGADCMLHCKIILLNPNAKVTIGDRVFIGDSLIFCNNDIEIGDDIMISWGCTIIDNNSHSLIWEERKNDVLDWIKGPINKNWSVVESKKISIQNKSWIGFNSIISKGVVVGEGSIVASGSVVTKSCDSYDIIGGNPAKFIKKTC